MEYVFIGTIVNTHGIKGEIRIISEFEYKNLIFKKGFKLYIGKEKKEVTINNYRIHKIYDMVTLKEYNNINQVLPFKGKKAYINRTDIDIPYLPNELIGFQVFDKTTNKIIGKLDKIKKMPKNDILVINKTLIPYIDEFVKKIDLENKQITVETIGGMINEN